MLTSGTCPLHCRMMYDYGYKGLRTNEQFEIDMVGLGLFFTNTAKSNHGHPESI